MTMNRILATANKIHNMNHNLPNILKTVYDEDRERQMDENNDEVQAIKYYEMRQIDTNYLRLV